jgi:LPS sulfotransferase NodH
MQAVSAKDACVFKHEGDMKDLCAREVAGSKTAFLIGAGRSGTTLLYKLLSLHPRAAYISNYDNRVAWLPAGLVAGIVSGRMNAKLKAWFNTGGNAYFIDRPLIKKLFPTPVEGESVYRSCGVPLYPEPGYLPDAGLCACLCAKFERIRHAFSADIMLSKRTANNRRLDVLEAVFPRARYIHLIRDGRDVANSLSRVEWWDDHVIWWDGRTAGQMEQDGEDRLEICARNWVREVRELSAGLSSIDADRVLDIRYEELLADPVGQLRSITDFLGLEMTADYRSAIESVGLANRTAGWQKLFSPQELEMMLRIQRPDLEKFGYL